MLGFLLNIYNFVFTNKSQIMLELILRLLLTLGLYSGSKNDKQVIVIDYSTGATYTIGVTNGSGGCISSTSPDTYYLIKDANGTYRLVRK